MPSWLVTLLTDIALAAIWFAVGHTFTRYIDLKHGDWKLGVKLLGKSFGYVDAIEGKGDSVKAILFAVDEQTAHAYFEPKDPPEET